MTIITKTRGRNAYTRGEASITTPEARAKLAPRNNPYYRRIDGPLHLGYRRCVSTTGTWIARRTVGQDRYEFKKLGPNDTVAFADDLGAPAGALDFAQAWTAAKNWFKTVANAPVASITVRDALTAYRAISEQRHAAKQANGPSTAKCYYWSSLQRVLTSAIIDIELNKLTKADLKAFRAELAASKTKSGEPLHVGTVRRICQNVSAALNHAARENDAITLTQDVVTAGFKAPLTEVYVNSRNAQSQVLNDRDIKAIVAAAQELDAERNVGGDLYRLVLVLAATGARFSQVNRIKVGEVDIANNRINVPVSRKGNGKPKKFSHSKMPVGPDVIAALAPALNGRHSTDYLLERRELVAVEGKVAQWEATGRGPWKASTELTDKLWKIIREKVGLGENIDCYSLRHSSIVSWLQRRIPTQMVARMHDTSSEMIEAHYSLHIGDVYDDLVADLARERSLAGAVVVPLKTAA